MRKLCLLLLFRVGGGVGGSLLCYCGLCVAVVGLVHTLEELENIRRERLRPYRILALPDIVGVLACVVATSHRCLLGATEGGFLLTKRDWRKKVLERDINFASILPSMH